MEGIPINYFTIYISAIIALVLVVIFTGPLIHYLRNHYIGQYIREDGPQEHQTKKGTPTMGGIVMTLAILISSLSVLLFVNALSLPVIMLLVCLSGFATAGFIDDYLKVIKKHNKGISGWVKLAFQFVFSAIIVVYMFMFRDISTVSFFNLANLDISYIYLIFGVFVIVGSSNAINLTDGLDGLAASTSAIAFFTLSYFLFNINNWPLAVVAAAIGGACIGFLVFNHHPAKIFMGDVGSLMMGGAFGAIGVLAGLEFWLIPIGIIFVVEALSVIIQVVSFKTTGKRVFKMSPLHHHFEICGDKETTVVGKFALVQAISCILAIIFGHMWLF